MGLCPIWPLGQRTLSGTGPLSPLVGQRLCAVGAATGALGRCALEKGARYFAKQESVLENVAARLLRAGQDAGRRDASDVATRFTLRRAANEQLDARAA